MKFRLYANTATLSPADARAEIVGAALRKDRRAVKRLLADSPSVINDDLRKQLRLLQCEDLLP